MARRYLAFDIETAKILPDGVWWATKKPSVRAQGGAPMEPKLSCSVALKSPADFIKQLASEIRDRWASDGELLDVLDTYVLKENPPGDGIEKASAAIMELAKRRAHKGE